jgi:predicted O-methyltransferase YrrM
MDLVFVDADKPGYISYCDELVPRAGHGGVLLGTPCCEAGTSPTTVSTTRTLWHLGVQ